MSWFLDLPNRGLILSAKTVADRLRLKPDAQVLEIGPGSEYFSVEVARRVPKGSITLLEIQPEMLAKNAERLKAAGIENFVTECSDGELLPFDSAAFDAIFLVTVFGEIEQRAAFLDEAARVRKGDGVLSITEHHPDPDFESAEKVAASLSEHGFVPSKKLGWRWVYTINASKRSTTGT